MKGEAVGSSLCVHLLSAGPLLKLGSLVLLPCLSHISLSAVDGISKWARNNNIMKKGLN